jgi:molecular chaperone GrpE
MSDDTQKSKETLESLEQKLQEAEAKIQENVDGWQRARADYANLQKEHTKQIENLKSYIIGGFVEDLLPVLDSFSMAMSNKEVWEKVDKNWRMGIEYILKQFNDTLDKYGVTEIPAKVGDKFNPEQHQAMESIETDDESKDGTIENVMQKGYKMNDTIIRPVKVKTFEFKNGSE